MGIGRNGMKRFLVILTLCMFSFVGMGDALYWMIDETSYVDNDPIKTFISPLPDDEDNWAVGRVKITTSTGVVKYLDIYSPDGNINNVGETYPGAEGVWIGGGGVFFGAEGNQGILPADVDPASSFAIELGINHWIDDGTEEGQINFELLAITDPHTYEQIEAFIHPQGSLGPPDLATWNPTYYHTVSPEPNSFLLLSLGLCLLGLKRKT